MFSFAEIVTKPLFYPEMEATGSSETLVPIYEATQHHISEDCNLQQSSLTALLSLYSDKYNFVLLQKCLFLQLGSYCLVLSDSNVYVCVLNGPILHIPVV
jgi:hypothetical protein